MIRRLCTALMLVCVAAGSARAQGTPMPNPLIQWFDNSGLVFSDGGLCVFVAGTSTLATTYTTAALSVANSNPIEFDAAGRPTSGGVFLTPGSSYKFVLKNFAGVVSPTCIPDTGVTVFTVDNVPAVPGSAAAVDVTATAGESIAAGEAVYVSTGAGGLNAGQLYKTDADLAYKSTSAAMVGLAPSAITSGNAGTIRISGAVTVAGPLSAGVPYYAGATAGALVATPPTNAVRLGAAVSATSFIVGYTQAPIGPRGPPCGRLTLTTGVPVTSSDVTAATTVYYTPAGSCNTIDLYDGTAWSQYAFAELSIAVPATTNTGYDVYAYDNAGVVALELTAWTNLTTRATALVLQNGVWSKTGVLTRRYLGSFRTTGVSGQTEDSITKRYLFNADNRARRPLRVIEATNSWTYTTAAWQQANANAANQVEVFIGLAEVTISLKVLGITNNASTTGQSGVGIGEDSATVLATGVIGGVHTQVFTTIHPVFSYLDKMPAVGWHFYAWLEHGSGSSPDTWYGDNGAALLQSGLSGWCEG